MKADKLTEAYLRKAQVRLEEYDLEDAEQAIDDAAFVYRIVSEAFGKTEEEPA